MAPEMEPLRVRNGSGRGDRIRTCDLFTPSEARYQAALRPDIFLSAGAFCQR